MAGDSSRARIWWLRYGKFFAVGMVLVSMRISKYFDVENPRGMALIIVVWVLSLATIVSLFGSWTAPERSRRTRGAEVRRLEGGGAVAGDTSWSRMVWVKYGKGAAAAISLVVWVGGTMVGFVSLTGFESDNPGLILLLIVVWVGGVFGIGWLFGGFRSSKQTWRPLVALLAEWAKGHGGAEDATPVDVEFHRIVVRSGASDERRTVWSAHATANGYPIRLLLHGVSGTSDTGDRLPGGVDGDIDLPTFHYTVMLADTGVELPSIVFAVPQADPDYSLMPDYTKRIEFESGEFNDTWKVRCVSVSTGHKVFDPRTMEILLELEATDIRILWEGTSVVVAREGLVSDVAELDRWLALIDRMVHNGRLIARSG